MKRDDDYIRSLLLEAEASDQPFLVASLLLSPEPDDLKRHMHCKWLSDARLFVEVNKDVFRITNQGHDYLAAIRDEGVWRRTKDVASSVSGVTLGIMKDIAVGIVKQEVAKYTGFPV